MANFIFKNTQAEIKGIKGIIFDKDGTLTNSNIFWAEIIKRRSLEIINFTKLDYSHFPYLCKIMGLDLKSNLLLPDGPIALKSRNEVINSLILNLKKLSININELSISEIFKKVHFEFYPNSENFIIPIKSACDFVSNCKLNDIRLALITSDTKLNAEMALKKLGLINYFDLIIGGDSGFGNKSNGKSAKFVAKSFNLMTENIISIGDAPSDYEMSTKANLKCSILVETGQVPIEKLQKLSDFSVKDLSNIHIKKIT